MSRELVQVGRVSRIAPGTGCSIIGIDVKDNVFAIGHKLIFRDPNGGQPNITIHVATLEVDRSRTNRTERGKEYGVKPYTEPLPVPPPNWLVFVPKAQALAAEKMQPKNWSRSSHIGAW